jgi:hypothetical protein
LLGRAKVGGEDMGPSWGEKVGADEDWVKLGVVEMGVSVGDTVAGCIVGLVVGAGVDGVELGFPVTATLGVRVGDAVAGCIVGLVVGAGVDGVELGFPVTATLGVRVGDAVVGAFVVGGWDGGWVCPIVGAVVAVISIWSRQAIPRTHALWSTNGVYEMLLLWQA